MKFGQMSIKGLSPNADYLQLDICGLSVEEALTRYISYRKTIDVVLHGDWTKKGASENNLLERLDDYRIITRKLLQLTNVLGFTIHPPFRKKLSFETFSMCCDELSSRTQVPVWMENRSGKQIWLSTPAEIIDNSLRKFMTIDIGQLYISCGYNKDLLMSTLSQIRWENVKEVHLSNLKRTEKNTFVARKLDDGELPMLEIVHQIRTVPHITLEILGGIPTFESQVYLLNKMTESGGNEAEQSTDE